ncbi:unnamed protein product [Cuscuta campestris]|uniref:Uncharacterized protein n=1 Tax=Cuscuta campestris TaxID=132261 RepID=A0A484MGA1_9ASTE|nr:unnamed protein product [Cuscuta campestris]
MSASQNPLTDHLTAIEARFKELHDSLRETVTQLQRDFETRLTLQSSKLDAQYNRVEALLIAGRTSNQHRGHGDKNLGGEFHVDRGGSSYTPKPKLESPKCDGSEPLRWLYKVKEYFEFYDTPPDERLRCITLMLEGAAADWFRWRMENKLIDGWDDFVDKFKQRFDPNQYIDYFGQLAKLRQQGAVIDYQTAFEKVLQHVSGANEEILVSLFHAGLKHHLQQEIAMHKPQTLSESFALARELEAKHLALVNSVQQRSSYGTSGGIPRQPVQGLRAAPTEPLLPTPPKPPSVPHTIRRLSPAEKAAKDAKGLCYNCDQKWSRTHKCGRFLLICGADAEEEDLSAEPEDDLLVTADISSLNNFAGLQPPRSLRLMGRIGSHDVRVLIDGGSTHNFIHPEIVARLQLPLQAVTPFWVYVGNGDAMPCASRCVGVPLLMQTHLFSVDLFVLQIHGQDIVLGVQWLQQFGKVSQDYAQLTLEFTWEGRSVQIQGDNAPKPVSLSMFRSLHASHLITDYYELLSVTHGECAVPAVDELLTERTALLHRLRENLQAAQARMKAAANPHRRDVQFHVGDWVLLKLQPYRQHSVVRRGSQKLARRFYGPYQILERIGSVAYRLDLPANSKIHPVFHVSLLRPYRGDSPTVTPLPLPVDLVDGRPPSRPLKAHAWQTTLVNGVPEQQVLVEWTDGGLHDATWEPVDALRRHYPDMHLEDKVPFEQGGNVTSTPLGDDGAVENECGEPTRDSDDGQPGDAGSPVRRGTRTRRPPAWHADYDT